MLSRVQSYLLHGIDALPCEVEVDYDDTDIDNRGGAIVGLPDAAVKEALDRVGAALSNSGYGWPRGKVLINLAPADVRKEGPVYDLPIAVGLLMVQGIVPTHVPKRGALSAPDPPGLDHRRMVFAGELALDGRLRPIKGAIALAAMARDKGAMGLVLPRDNAQEAAVVGGLAVYGCGTLAEVVGLLTGHLEAQPHSPVDVESLLQNAAAPIDFVEIRGQEGVKRAITIAAAGSHNLLRLWPSAGHRGGVRGGGRSRAVGHSRFQLWPSGGDGGVKRRGVQRIGFPEGNRALGIEPNLPVPVEPLRPESPKKVIVADTLTGGCLEAVPGIRFVPTPMTQPPA